MKEGAKDKKRIAITVIDGMVMSVYADIDAEVVIIDFDSFDEDSAKQADADFEGIQMDDSMQVVY